MKLYSLFTISFLCALLLGISSCDTRNAAVDEVTIYGSVIDQKTGQPLYNVLIQEKNKVGGSTVTGNDGNYEFTLLINGSSGGNYYLVASKEGYMPSEYELNMSKVDKNRRVKVDFQLSIDRATTVFSYVGKVTDKSGKPLKNAEVEYYRISKDQSKTILKQKFTRTDEKGDYTIELEESDIPKEHNYVVMLGVFLDGYNGQDFLYDEPEVIGKSVKIDFVLESAN